MGEACPVAGSPGPGRAVWSTGRPLSLSLTNAGTERLLTSKCWPRTGPENENDGLSEEMGLVTRARRPVTQQQGGGRCARE